jgi:hypothetical protein
LRLKREAKGNEIINEKEEEKRKALAKRFISKDSLTSNLTRERSTNAHSALQ